MADPGVLFDTKKPIQRKGIEPTQVKSIKLISDLDDGAANDGSGAIKEKSGLVFGKTYKFEVESYTNGEPKDPDLIKWAVSYTDKETGKFYKNVLESSFTGHEISITFNDPNGCGNYLDIKAYINDIDNEGKLTLFKHNRFRFFDRKIFENALNARKASAKLINQSATSLCGTAALLYLFAKQYKDIFFNSYKEFFRKGEASINNFKLKPNPEIYDMKPGKDNEDYPHFTDKKTKQVSSVMNTADWITLVGTRSSDNKAYTGKDGEDWDAINWPSYMVKAAKQLFNTSNVIDKTHFITGLNYANTLKSIENDFNSGWKIILLIDSDMLNDSVSYLGSLTNYHWIVYNGGLVIDEKTKKYSFSYYCWGREYSVNFRSIVFNTNFYGYIKFK